MTLLETCYWRGTQYWFSDGDLTKLVSAELKRSVNVSIVSSVLLYCEAANTVVSTNAVSNYKPVRHYGARNLRPAPDEEMLSFLQASISAGKLDLAQLFNLGCFVDPDKSYGWLLVQIRADLYDFLYTRELVYALCSSERDDITGSNLARTALVFLDVDPTELLNTIKLWHVMHESAAEHKAKAYTYLHNSGFRKRWSKRLRSKTKLCNYAGSWWNNTGLFQKDDKWKSV